MKVGIFGTERLGTITDWAKRAEFVYVYALGSKEADDLDARMPVNVMVTNYAEDAFEGVDVFVVATTDEPLLNVCAHLAEKYLVAGTLLVVEHAPLQSAAKIFENLRSKDVFVAMTYGPGMIAGMDEDSVAAAKIACA